MLFGFFSFFVTFGRFWSVWGPPGGRHSCYRRGKQHLLGRFAPSCAAGGPGGDAAPISSGEAELRAEVERRKASNTSSCSGVKDGMKVSSAERISINVAPTTPIGIDADGRKATALFFDAPLNQGLHQRLGATSRWDPDTVVGEARHLDTVLR